MKALLHPVRAIRDAIPGLVRRSALVCLAASLAACGGSGGGNGNGSPPPNRAPTADAGADQSVVEGLQATLSAANSSDADGSIASYAWTQTDGPAVTLQGADTATVTFDTPLTDVELMFTFSVTVTDNDGASATATTTVTVEPSQPPTVDAGPDADWVEGQTVMLDATVTDTDGTIASYAWTQISGPAVTLSDAAVEDPSFAAPLVTGVTDLEFELTATDSTNDAASDTVVITLNPSQPPVVNAGTDLETVEGEPVTLAGAATDVDGAVVAYAWLQTAGPAVTLTQADTPGPSFDAPVVAVATDLEFELTATDNTNDAASDTVVVTVDPNEPPALAIRFPCDGCRAYGSALSVAGTVDAGPDNAFVAGMDGISSVLVDAGNGTVSAIVQSDGQWLAQNVLLPADGDTVSLTVTAEDFYGETTQSTADLEYGPTLTGVIVAHDPVSADVLYIYDGNNPRQRLFKFDTALGTHTLVREAATPSDNVSSPRDAAVTDDGTTLLLLDALIGIKAVDLASGELSAISDATHGGGPAFSQPLMMAYDPDDGRVLVFDSDQLALYSVDLATGDRVVLSNNSGIGSGPAFADPEALAVDAADDVAFVKESASSDILSVDLATGDRSTVPESGYSIGLVPSMRFDAGRARLAVLEWTKGSVATVDWPSGVRALLSDGGSLAAGDPLQVTFDTMADRYVVNDYSFNFSGDTDRLLAVDPDTGVRSVLFDDALGSGPLVQGIAAVDVDPDAGIVYLASETADNVIRLDLATGTREVLSDAVTGTGAAIGTFRDVSFDQAGNRLLIVDSANAWLMAVDLATGNRSVVSGGAVGTGTALSLPVAIAPDYANGRAFVVDQGAEAVVEVDLASGERTTLSDTGNAGVALVDANGIALDADNDRLLVTVSGNGSTAENALLAVDLSSGDRTVVSDFTTGNGPLLDDLRAIRLFADGGSALVTSSTAYYRVDLATGNRQLLVDSDTANGESLYNALGVAYDATQNVIYTWSTNFDALFEVDAVTGDRVVVNK